MTDPSKIAQIITFFFFKGERENDVKNENAPVL